MKFIRNNKVRERIIDVVSKAILIAVSGLVCLWMISGARAGGAPEIIGIHSQALEDGAYAVDFTLSQKLEKSSVNVEFERNFIQVSLKGVSAYPARTENINASVLEKVFTYQYQPDLARARVLLKTAAASIKDKCSWELTKQGLRILIKAAGNAPHLAVKSAAIVSDNVKTKAATFSSQPIDPEEEKIVKEILEESKFGASAASSTAAAIVEKKAPLANEDQPLFAATNRSASEKTDEKGKDSAATRILASLLLVIGVIGASAVAFRRFVLGKGIPFQKQNRVIEVVASQSLGPKRSIAVIKVLDQYMVVGMAGEGMSLLANLGADVKIEKFLDQAGSGASFSDTFDSALSGPVSASRAIEPTGSSTTHKRGMDLGIRDSIKKRIEGFKPL